jgi:LmbE family N-acetylglucosaminyl deacetylase
VATLVCFHAHPDDESIATGGTMAAAAAAGHRVVLVVATNGEEGEPVPGVLRADEALHERRVQEVHAAAEILGVEQVHLLGYRDSGMMGEPTNDHPGAFWQAPLPEAGDRLGAILDEVGCDVLTVYDDHGGYGHPDHIQVHRVGHEAARRAGVGLVYEATMNRTHLVELMERAGELGLETPDAPDAERQERARDESFGTPAEHITHAVDVTGQLERKRAAMIAHASQIAPDSFFLAMPDEAFAAAFGTEWYIRPGHRRGADAPFVTDLFG